MLLDQAWRFVGLGLPSVTSPKLRLSWITDSPLQPSECPPHEWAHVAVDVTTGRIVHARCAAKPSCHAAVGDGGLLEVAARAPMRLHNTSVPVLVASFASPRRRCQQLSASLRSLPRDRLADAHIPVVEAGGTNATARRLWTDSELEAALGQSSGTRPASSLKVALHASGFHADVRLGLRAPGSMPARVLSLLATSSFARHGANAPTVVASAMDPATAAAGTVAAAAGHLTVRLTAPLAGAWALHALPVDSAAPVGMAIDLVAAQVAWAPLLPGGLRLHLHAAFPRTQHASGLLSAVQEMRLARLLNALTDVPGMAELEEEAYFHSLVAAVAWQVSTLLPPRVRQLANREAEGLSRGQCSALTAALFTCVRNEARVVEFPVLSEAEEEELVRTTLRVLVSALAAGRSLRTVLGDASIPPSSAWVHAQSVALVLLLAAVGRELRRRLCRLTIKVDGETFVQLGRSDVFVSRRLLGRGNSSKVMAGIHHGVPVAVRQSRAQSARCCPSPALLLALPRAAARWWRSLQCFLRGQSDAMVQRDPTRGARTQLLAHAPPLNWQLVHRATSAAGCRCRPTLCGAASISRYFAYVRCGNHEFDAVELCHGTLAAPHALERLVNCAPVDMRTQLLRGLVRDLLAAMCHLHTLSPPIAARRLLPQDVYFLSPPGAGAPRLKLLLRRRVACTGKQAVQQHMDMAAVAGLVMQLLTPQLVEAPPPHAQRPFDQAPASQPQLKRRELNAEESVLVCHLLRPALEDIVPSIIRLRGRKLDMARTLARALQALRHKRELYRAHSARALLAAAQSPRAAAAAAPASRIPALLLPMIPTLPRSLIHIAGWYFRARGQDLPAPVHKCLSTSHAAAADASARADARASCEAAAAAAAAATAGPRSPSRITRAIAQHATATLRRFVRRGPSPDALAAVAGAAAQEDADAQRAGLLLAVMSMHHRSPLPHDTWRRLVDDFSFWPRRNQLHMLGVASQCLEAAADWARVECGRLNVALHALGKARKAQARVCRTHSRGAMRSGSGHGLPLCGDSRSSSLSSLAGLFAAGDATDTSADATPTPEPAAAATPASTPLPPSPVESAAAAAAATAATAAERMEALGMKVEDSLSALAHSPSALLLEALEAAAPVVAGEQGWQRAVDDDLVRHWSQGRFRRYNPHSVRDLVRAVRNTTAHFDNLPLALARTIGVTHEQLHDYFFSRFPDLLLCVHWAFVAVFGRARNFPSMLRSVYEDQGAEE